MKKKSFVKRQIKRMDIFIAELSEGEGSEQKGERPVLILQNNVGNKFSPTVVVSMITGKINKARLPTHVEISTEYGLEMDSLILLEQIQTIDKNRLKGKITHIEGPIVEEIEKALSISLGLLKF